MHALYRINLCRGEDRSFPVTLVYHNPETGAREAADITGRRFLMTVRSEPEGEVLARLSTDDGNIVLGKMVDREFVETSDEATTILIQFTHDITEKLIGKNVNVATDGTISVKLFSDVGDMRERSAKKPTYGLA